MVIHAPISPGCVAIRYMIVARTLSYINSLKLWRRPVRVFGFNVTPTRGDRLLALYLHRFGLMGGEALALFRKFIPPGAKVVDVGANQGLYTLIFSGLVGPTGRIYSFEPDPELFEIFTHNCEANQVKNVERFNYALGAKDEGKLLFRSRINAGDNRLAKSDRDDWFEAIQVRCTRLDSILPAAQVQFIKIDVQGWEFEVFQGMTGLWDANPDLIIYFEFWPFGLRRGGCDPERLLGYLAEHGFRIYEPSSDKQERILDFKEFSERFSGVKSTNLLAVRGAISHGL